MRLAVFLCLCCALPGFSQEAACDSAAQIIDANGQLMIRNVSDTSILAYFIASHDRERTYRGTFTEGDSLGSSQSLEIGRADVAASELSDYVRLADRWQCGEAPPQDRASEEAGSSPR